MLASKLKPGDEIRVISPARSLSIISDNVQASAKTRLEASGYKITFGKNSRILDEVHSSSIKQRLEDIHDAFRDPSVKAIMTSIGGFNSNELLPYLDYDLIKSNPKILVGYSDITALGNAIYSKTGLVTYSGPHFSSFGEEKGFDYSQVSFDECLTKNEAYSVTPSPTWSEDRWYKDQDKRSYKPNSGWQVINEGKCSGTIVGGNLCTLNLLQGTQYMPNLDNKVLFLEEDSMGVLDIGLFTRNLTSLTQQPGFENVVGLVFGRFGSKCDIDDKRLSNAIKSNDKLSNIPILSGVDFGHTEPRITFPVGGSVTINASAGGPSIIIEEH